ncbi:MAG: hypothetical protein AAFN18_05330 [Cyanobacteria bacterium J06554_6]
MVGHFELGARAKRTDRGDGRATIALLAALFIGICLFLIAFLKPGIWGVDGNDMLQMSQSLITKGNFTIAPSSGGIEGPDGQFYSIRYPLLPIVAIPFVGLGMAVGHLLNLPVQYTSATCGLVLNILLTAGTAVVIWLMTVRLGGTRHGAYIAAVGFTFGTVALVYSREFFAEPLLSFIMTLALYLAFGKSSAAHVGAGVLAALAIAAKPAGILLAPVLALYFLMKRYAWWRVLTPCVGGAVGIGLFLLYNYVRFGNWTSSGQDASQLSFDGFLGRAVGQLVSPGAGGGLFLYCPPTVLAMAGIWVLWRQRRAEMVALLGIFMGFWLLHSGWGFNGWNWGPRFLVPIIPAMMVSVGLLGRRWRMPTLGLIILGFVINSPTLVAFYQRYFAEIADQDTGLLMQALSLWGEPAGSPILNVWGATFRQLQAAFSTPVQEIVANVGAPPELGELANAELLRIVAVWWWFLPVAGFPVWVGFAIAFLLVSASVWLLWRGWQLSLRLPKAMPN